MKKYDVLCPHCCGTFLETNINFREDAPANGSMFEAKQHIKDAAWTVFPLYDSTEYMDLICPSCEGVLVDSGGKVLRMVESGEIETTKPATDIIGQKSVADIMAELMAEYDPAPPVSIVVSGDVRHDCNQDDDAVLPEPGEPTAPDIIALCERISKGNGDTSFSQAMISTIESSVTYGTVDGAPTTPYPEPSPYEGVPDIFIERPIRDDFFVTEPLPMLIKKTRKPITKKA